MVKKTLLKTMLLLCALVAGMSSAWADVSNGDVFERVSAVEDLSDGDEIIFVNQAETYACGTTQNTNNRTPVSISVSDHTYTYASTNNVQVFVVKINSKGQFGFHTGSGYIYSASNSNNNLKTNTDQASTAPSEASAWTLNVTNYVFAATNVTNTSYYLAFNGTSYFSQYKSGQSKPYIYKKKAASATALEVKNTSTNKTNFKVGEKLDLTGLVLDATVGGNHVDVTSGYTAKIGLTTVTSGTTVLNDVGAQIITFTYGGQTCTQTIHVGELKGIVITTAPTKTTYVEGQTFDPTGMVVTATFSDMEETPAEWTEDVAEDCTFSPSDPLKTSDTKITVTYKWGDNSDTADQAITVGSLDHLTYNATGDGAFAHTSYTEQDKFNAEGLVVNAHFTNGIVNNNISGYTLSPNTDTQLTTSDDHVTVSYTWEGTTKTIDIPITVSDGPQYSVTFSAEGGSCATASLPEADYKAGVTLPEATISTAGWVFAGWKETSAATNTTTRPTLFAAGSIYKPTADCTLYAVYTLETTNGYEYIRATTLDEITRAQSVVIVNNGKVLDNKIGSVQAPSETNSEITAYDDIIWVLSGNNTNGYTLTNNALTSTTKTLGINNIPSSSANLTININNKKWLFVESTHISHPNEFVIRNTELNSGNKVGSIEYYNNAWKVYCLAQASFAGNDNIALKIYVPKTAYNSNPSAIITPTVEFEKDGTTLYLDADDKTYTNTATVEGVSKPITYSSSNEDVATVTSAGVVTAVGIGTATITASVAQELGVSNAAQDTYEVTVKNTTTIAGIKAVNSTTTATAFTADLTDANITYVSGTRAYIQDASAAIYVSCATNDWVAGKKFTGAVSGKVKKSYGVWEITELTGTPVEGGTVPAALTDVAIADITTQTYESYEGKKITLTGITVTTAMASTATSGGEVSDGTNTIKIGAPATGVTLVENERGNVTGFVAQYSGTYRLNLYEQSQFVKTHNAPTAQDLSFTSDAIELDEDTEAFTNFTPQTVGGAKGTVTYAIANTSGDVIYDNFNTADGTFTLKTGVYGTATITATAAAADISEGGVTTPYTETTKSYTVTTYPRYTSTFSINGEVTVARQATHGAAITVPTPANIGDYYFMGWKAAEAIAEPTNTAPTMVTPPTTPTSNVTYYAVYAQILPENISTVTDELTRATTGVADATNGTVSYSNWSGKNGTSGAVYAGKSAGGYNSIQLRSKNSDSGIITTSSGGKVKKVTVEWNSNTASGKTLDIYGKDAAYSAASDLYGSASGAILGSIVCGTSTELTVTGDYAFVGIRSNDGALYLDKVSIKWESATPTGYRTSLPTETSVSITTADYATFSNSRATNFSATGIKVYKAKVENKAVKLTEITGGIVPANTGVILYKDVDATANITVPFTTTDATISDNELVGTTSRTLVKMTEDNINFNYIMQLDGGSIVFNMATVDGAYMPAGKAYLSTAYDASASVARLSVVFADETQSIRTIDNSQMTIDNSVYNLRGQRVSQPGKGLYIVNGKKVLVK